MNTSSDNSPVPSEAALRKLHLRIHGTNPNTQEAREAARQLQAHLPTPSLRNHVWFLTKQPSFTLAKPSLNAPILEQPTALFQVCLPTEIGEPPEAWLPAYRFWAQMLCRGVEFESLFPRCVEAIREEATGEDIVVQSPVVAGLLLLLLGPQPDMPLREHLMEVALALPDPTCAFSAYLAAEGHLLKSEHDTVLQGLRADSQALFWAAQLPRFADRCAEMTLGHHDLYAGLTLASSESHASLLDAWLRKTLLSACDDPAAACAALVLQPGADSTLKGLWLNTLKRDEAAQQAYEAVRWARFTWLPNQWQELKQTLRPYAVRDRGHWFQAVEPENARSALGDPEADPLWCVQLLAASEDLDDYTFRFRLGEMMDTRILGPETIIYDWLNQRALARRNRGSDDATL